MPLESLKSNEGEGQYLVLELQNTISKLFLENVVNEALSSVSISNNVNIFSLSQRLTDYIFNRDKKNDFQMENIIASIMSSESDSARKFKYLYNNKNRNINYVLGELNKLTSIESEINQSQEKWFKDWAKEKFFSEKNTSNTLECLSIYNRLDGVDKPNFLPFYLAYFFYKNKNPKNHNLTIVDFSKNKRDNRFYMIDMDSGKIIYSIQCAQGRGYSNKKHSYGVDSLYVNGNDRRFVGKPIVSKANEFSNNDSSYLSSLGGMETPALRWGRHSVGDSLLVKGHESGFNDNVSRRGIYVHGGLSATNEPSEGCFVIENIYLRGVLTKMQGGGLIYAYYPDQKYLTDPKSFANLT